MENAVRGPASTCRDPWNQQKVVAGVPTALRLWKTPSGGRHPPAETRGTNKVVAGAPTALWVVAGSLPAVASGEGWVPTAP
ncbi:MAG TPA: hypothetical protein VGA56_11845 [Opitutaceae bacterium]